MRPPAGCCGCRVRESRPRKPTGQGPTTCAPPQPVPILLTCWCHCVIVSNFYIFGCAAPAIGSTKAVNGDCHKWDWHQIQLKYLWSINVESEMIHGNEFSLTLHPPHPPPPEKFSICLVFFTILPQYGNNRTQKLLYRLGLILTDQDCSDLKIETLSEQAPCIDDYNCN